MVERGRQDVLQLGYQPTRRFPIVKRILLTSWLTDVLFTRLPFLEKKAPWYRRYRLTASPWVPAALIAPLALFLLIEGVRQYLASPTTEPDED
jgi:hypothetical protein